jgi:hypothetical protein
MWLGGDCRFDLAMWISSSCNISTAWAWRMMSKIHNTFIIQTWAKGSRALCIMLDVILFVGSSIPKSGNWNLPVLCADNISSIHNLLICPTCSGSYYFLVPLAFYYYWFVMMCWYGRDLLFEMLTLWYLNSWVLWRHQIFETWSYLWWQPHLLTTLSKCSLSLCVPSFSSFWLVS